MLALLERRALGVAGGIALVVAAAAAVVSCGAVSESSSGSGFGGEDAGSNDGSSQDGNNGSPPDASFDGGGGAPPIVLAVHASPDLYDFRLCFGVTNDADGGGYESLPGAPFPDDAYGPMAASNYPGVPLGGAAPLRSLPTGGSYVVPYVIRADRLIQSKDSCGALLCNGGGCLMPHYDYERLAPIPVTTFARNERYVLAVTGCNLASDGCSAAGPLRATVVPLSFSTGPSPGQIHAQLVHLAPLLGPTEVTVDGDGRMFPLQAFGSASESAPFDAPDAGDLAGYASKAVHVTWGDGGARADFSLALIARLSNPTPLPSTYFEQPSSFVFGVLGDPDAAPPTIDGGINPQFDGKGLHVIAVPIKAADPIDGGQ